MSEYFGKEVPKLGFGLMRLPRKLLATDVEQVKQMVDRFMEAGFTYFDTAFVYPGSEATIQKALVARYPRESFTLATKLNAMMAPTEKAWDFVKEQKEKGLVKHYGFSFHGGPELLDRLLTEHPDVDFVQLQINYADWENPSVTSRRNYEIARRHGKSIVVMEPVKGGKLANPPEEVGKLFKAYHPDMSCASWAIRFVASLDGILTVLSGMSNVEQMEDNLSYMKDFRPLNEEEQAIIREAQRVLGESKTIPCTACRYCVEGCPKQIPIPEIFAAVNLHLGNGQMEEARQNYRAAVSEGHGASDCIQCRRCEQACPQHLPVTDHLKQAAELFFE